MLTELLLAVSAHTGYPGVYIRDALTVSHAQKISMAPVQENYGLLARGAEPNVHGTDFPWRGGNAARFSAAPPGWS